MSKPLSVYIHIPFCERKCAYCDFVSFDNKAAFIGKYINALCAEIKNFYLQNTCEDTVIRDCHSIFIGGGTPSLLSDSQLTKIFSALRHTFNIPKGTEITIEANPNSITEKKLHYWRSLGINRLSIGVQSFSDSTLKTLGRIHTSAQAVRAVESARRAGFKNINIDLIHSVPTGGIIRKKFITHQDKKLLSRVLRLVTHVSAYSLIIEPNTPFEKKYKPVSEKQSIKEQTQIEKILKKHGFKKYEVSNFAKKSNKSKYECSHNKAYWRPQTNEYIGFGLAAHSLLSGRRFSNTNDLSEYINPAHLKSNHTKPRTNAAELTNKDLITEIIMLGLRTAGGIKFADLQELGYNLASLKAEEINLLEKNKFIKISSAGISATEKGFLVLNQIIDKLTPE